MGIKGTCMQGLFTGIKPNFGHTQPRVSDAAPLKPHTKTPESNTSISINIPVKVHLCCSLSQAHLQVRKLQVQVLGSYTEEC